MTRCAAPVDSRLGTRCVASVALRQGGTEFVRHPSAHPKLRATSAHNKWVPAQQVAATSTKPAKTKLLADRVRHFAPKK